MTRRALLVGIDNYPDPRNNLNSCVADTQVFRALLQNSYGFDSSEVRLLHNRDATLDNVRSGLDDLFAGVQAGDQIVYFQSSHGYRYPEGDTMVEVLCAYDGFLADTELAERSQDLPPEVLTIVLDACHSGGMNKLFFPGQSTHVARVKAWQPAPAEAERHAQLYTQVSRFKFFGRTATADTGAVAMNLLLNPRGVGAPKSLDESAVDLNGALFAACLADQTAAAGSPPTDNYSAFTYGLINETSPGISLTELSQRVGDRLAGLNMSQTPIAIAPPAHQDLLTDEFITMRPGTEPDADLYRWLREQLSQPA